MSNSLLSEAGRVARLRWSRGDINSFLNFKSTVFHPFPLFFFLTPYFPLLIFCSDNKLYCVQAVFTRLENYENSYIMCKKGLYDVK